jgi:hypothetical protein
MKVLKYNSLFTSAGIYDMFLYVQKMSSSAYCAPSFIGFVVSGGI